MNKAKNIRSLPVTVKTFPLHMEQYLRTRDLVILPRESVVKMTEAMGVFGMALQILGAKGLLDTDEGGSSIEIAKR